MTGFNEQIAGKSRVIEERSVGPSSLTTSFTALAEGIIQSRVRGQQHSQQTLATSFHLFQQPDRCLCVRVLSVLCP